MTNENEIPPIEKTEEILVEESLQTKEQSNCRLDHESLKNELYAKNISGCCPDCDLLLNDVDRDNFGKPISYESGPTIIPQPKQNVILDATILSTIMSCARLGDFRFNLHLQSTGGKSVSLEMGSIVHQFLETYYKAIIMGLKKSDAAGNAYISAQEYSNSSEVLNSSSEDRSWALETCNQYLEFYKNDFWTPLEVEVVKGRVLYEDDEIRILWKAKLDLITDTNQGIYAVDHKTMKQRRDTISLNNQFTGQCILTDARMMFVNKIGFQKSLKPAERFLRVPVSYSADRILEWQSAILPYWVKLWLMYKEGEYYPPNYTHCENKYGFCQFRDACEADRGLREETLGQNFVVGPVWDIDNDD